MKHIVTFFGQLTNMISKIIFILTFGLLFSCQGKHASDNSNKGFNDAFNNYSDALTRDLNKIYKQGHIKGFSVAIVNQDSTLYEEGFGYADLKTQKIYSEHTIQNIASISKTFLGIALLKAQEMGKLNLDDPVNSYLPFEVINPYHPEALITIRHLATHTSTIKDTEYYGNKAYVLKDDIGRSEESVQTYVNLNPPTYHMSMLDYLKKTLPSEGLWYKKEGYLNNKPGELFEYSNVATTLAALALEKAAGESYDKFTRKHIFDPLKMSSTGWSFKEINLSKHTKLYLDQNTEIPFYSLITYPDGGLITSAVDLGMYLKELIKGYNGNGTLLNKSSYAEFFTKQLKPENFPDPHGENEGIFVSFDSNGYIGHSGRDPGVSTYMFFDPGTDVGKILLVNTELDPEGEKQYETILKKLDAYRNKGR